MHMIYQTILVSAVSQEDCTVLLGQHAAAISDIQGSIYTTISPPGSLLTATGQVKRDFLQLGRAWRLVELL